MSFKDKLLRSVDWLPGLPFEGAVEPDGPAVDVGNLDHPPLGGRRTLKVRHVSATGWRWKTMFREMEPGDVAAIFFPDRQSFKAALLDFRSAVGNVRQQAGIVIRSRAKNGCIFYGRKGRLFADPHYKESDMSRFERLFAITAESGVKTIWDKETNRFMRSVQCGCGAQLVKSHKPDGPPHIIVRSFLNSGWKLRGKTWTCPDCVSGRKTETRADADKAIEIKPEERVIAPVAIPATDQAATEQGDEPMAKVEATNGKAVNFKIMASVLSALETKILSGTGRYPPGVTDETIAKETGAAVAFVRQAREELYGVQVHPDIAALLDRLDALDGELAAIRGLLQDVEAKRATLAADVKKMEYDPRFRL